MSDWVFIGSLIIGAGGLSIGGAMALGEAGWLLGFGAWFMLYAIATELRLMRKP